MQCRPGWPERYAFGSGHLIGISGAVGGLAPLAAGAAVAVPEPQDGALVMAGMGVLWLLRKRKGIQGHGLDTPA